MFEKNIDYLKAGCMLFIVAYVHLFNYTDAFPGHMTLLFEKLLSTVLGVFVLVSGYLSGLRYTRDGSPIIYYKKRLIRIYPLFVISMLLFCMIGMVTWSECMQSLWLVTVIKGPLPYTLWFVIVLMIYTLTTPLLLSRDLGSFDFTLRSFLLFLFVLVLATMLPTLDLRLLKYLPCFLCGLFVGSKKRSVLTGNQIVMLVRLYLISVILSLIDVENLIVDTVLQIPQLTFSALVVFEVVRKCESLLPSLSVIRTLSYSSFCIYLCHRPVFHVGEVIYPSTTGITQILYLYLVMIPVIFCLSYAIQKLYDRSVSYFVSHANMLVYIEKNKI
ncbi:MAG: acyltransferase [Desulfobulbaceae bacterium]|nr:MAG: acyltransferase [Desulfobulbaceae bacterium]